MRRWSCRGWEPVLHYEAWRQCRLLRFQMRFPQKSGPVFQINTTVQVFLLSLGVSMWQYKSIPQLNLSAFMLRCQLCRPFSHKLIWLSPVLTCPEITIIYLTENSKLTWWLSGKIISLLLIFLQHQGARTLSLYTNAWFYKWFKCWKCFNRWRRGKWAFLQL